MEKPPESEQPEVEKGVYHSKIGDFETLKPSELKVDDVKEGDRVIVTTSSGNRYMFRRSESSGGKIKVLNEREGDFNAGHGGHLFRLKEDAGDLIAKVGESLVIGVEDGENIRPWHSTTVTGVEIRIGVDDAVKRIASEGNVGMSGIAEGLKRHTNPKIRFGDEDKEE